jgi:ribosomal protein S27E
MEMWFLFERSSMIGVPMITMRCAICGTRIDSVDDAVEQGWTPYFYDGKPEHEVACPACIHALLQEHKEGELEVKEE